MKLLFLDIDGVLNSYALNKPFLTALKDGVIRKGKADGDTSPDSRVHRFLSIDFSKTNLIADFCERCGFKIVLSSSWRYSSGLEKTIDSLKRFSGFDVLMPYLIGQTDHIAYMDRDRLNRYKQDPHYGERGAEIQDYLDTHEDIEDYLIIDDDVDMLSNQMEHFYNTDNWDGFTHRDYINLLKKHSDYDDEY